MNREPVLYDPETDTLLVELRQWPAASPADVCSTSNACGRPSDTWWTDQPLLDILAADLVVDPE